MPAIVQTFLNPIFPVFAIMLLGLLLGRRGLFDFAAAQIINKFVFYAVLPPLIFSLTFAAPLADLNYRVLGSYFLSELVLFAATAAVARFWLKRPGAEAVLLGMAAAFVNHVFFVLPIATILYGDQVILPLSAIISVDIVVIFCGTIIGLEIATHRGDSLIRVAASFLRNPVLIAMALGLLVNIAGVGLPGGIETYIGFTGKAAAPAALFSLGIIMAEAKLRHLDRAALTVTAIKVLIHPLVVWLLLSLATGLDPVWGRTVLLTSAGPCGAMPFVLALQYKVGAESIGLAIVYSTVASLFTLSVIA